MDEHTIQHRPLPVINHQAVNKQYADDNFLKLSGGTMTGDINMGGNKITGLFQIPLAPFQAPQNLTDTNMRKYILGFT